MPVTVRSWTRVALAMFGIGWGANQFAPMLLVYRANQHLSEAAVTAMFGVYALGLIPALLVAGSFADQRGRRTVMRPMVVLSVVATLVLMAGSSFPELLYLGRFLGGVAAGGAISAGSAWVKELSVGARAGAGARRVAIALSGGFGGGPLIAGLVAQWGAMPSLTPYLLHVALMLVAIPVVWNAPDVSIAAGSGASFARPRFPRVAAHPRFAIAVVPWSPWVFGTVTIGFAVIPTLAVGRLGGAPIAFSGAISGLTLLTGAFVQPIARRLSNFGEGLTIAVGLLTGSAGFGVGTFVAVTGSALLVPVASILLGASYGTMLVSGLRALEALVDDRELASLAAIFYSLTYIGFGAPYLFAVVAPHAGYALCLIAAAIIMLITCVPVLRAIRDNPIDTCEPEGLVIPTILVEPAVVELMS